MIDPELAEHALWDDELTENLEEMCAPRDAFAAWARREGIWDRLNGDRYCDMAVAFRAGCQAGREAP